MLQRKRRYAVTLILAVTCLPLSARTLSAQDAQPPVPQAANPVPDPNAQIDSLLGRADLDPTLRMQLDLFKQINQRRAEAGLPPLSLDARLMASAAEHSADMAAGRFCRHSGRNGSSARARIRAHGYPSNNWSGENIICSRRTPDAAMAWWMNSGPHRRNILHRHYTHIGIGVDPNGPYGPMWTLNFGAGASDTVAPDFLVNPPVQLAEAAPPPAEPAAPAAENAEPPPPESAPAAPPAEGGGDKSAAVTSAGAAAPGAP